MPPMVVVATFNQEKALVGAFSVITNLRMELFQALASTHLVPSFVMAITDDSWAKFPVFMLQHFLFVLTLTPRTNPGPDQPKCGNYRIFAVWHQISQREVSVYNGKH